ncbi:MAG: DCC1-like thiol-disulfide oxidoreductase family protein [Chloroflexi bacterium]|nr:DCC1-like thiol-disulfide oxidoreductase family protein [Chloroflexota bacterium]
MLTALYDGRCIICQSTRGTITALDWRHRVRFIDLHDRDAWQSRFPQLKDADLLGAIHVIDERGAVFAGIDATRRMLRELPLGFPLWLLLLLPGTDTVGKRLYRYIARRRYRINELLGNELPECADGGCHLPR